MAQILQPNVVILGVIMAGASPRPVHPVDLLSRCTQVQRHIKSMSSDYLLKIARLTLRTLFGHHPDRFRGQLKV
jgi:hypothetical protein